MKQDVLNKLISIVGKERCKTAPEDLLAYSYDASIHEFMPEAVVLPKTTEEVSRIMKLCSANNVYVTPRGAASGLGGEALAKQGGIVLSSTTMNRIIEINTANRYAIVEPGVVVSDLQKAVEELNLFYPPDPGSANVATIGGTVMMNSGGMRGIKYGVTRDYLLGMEIVLPSGDVMKTGTVTVKDVTGFDLTRLICGSEGTLALATKITAGQEAPNLRFRHFQCCDSGLSVVAIDRQILRFAVRCCTGCCTELRSESFGDVRPEVRRHSAGLAAHSSEGSRPRTRAAARATTNLRTPALPRGMPRWR